jgi:hypothetical protein
MLRKLLGAGAVAACLIGSAQPAYAAPTDCWFFDDDNQYDVQPVDCDVTLRTEPSDRTTSGYLRTWVISEPNSSYTVEAVLWEDGDAEYTFIDGRGNVTSRVEGEWWTDSDDDTRLEFGEGNDGVDYSMAFTKPSSDYGAGASYPPAGFDGGGSGGFPGESYQPTRGGGLSSGEFSDRPFSF